MSPAKFYIHGFLESTTKSSCIKTWKRLAGIWEDWKSSQLCAVILPYLPFLAVHLQPIALSAVGAGLAPRPTLALCSKGAEWPTVTAWQPLPVEFSSCWELPCQNPFHTMMETKLEITQKLARFLRAFISWSALLPSYVIHIFSEICRMVFLMLFPLRRGMRDIKSNTCKISVFQCKSQQAKKYSD